MASRSFKTDHQEVTPSDRAVALGLLSQPSGRAHQHVERFLYGGAAPGRLRIVVRFHDGKLGGSQVEPGLLVRVVLVGDHMKKGPPCLFGAHGEARVVFGAVLHNGDAN